MFGGSSHPALAESICVKLGTTPAKCSLGKYSNGEIGVQIGTVTVNASERSRSLVLGCSIREQDVFVLQSGGSKYVDLISLHMPSTLMRVGSTTVSWNSSL